MNAIERLIKKFSEFPGIGPKQARRFVYYLITRSPSYIEEFKNEISELKESVSICPDCRRYFSINGAKNKICGICLDESRDTSSLLVVSRDIDFENIEKSKVFNGKYFILGGLIPILDKEPEKRIRYDALISYIRKLIDNGLTEIIIALDANSEGEYTAEFLKKNLAEKFLNLKISELGRGLSTGSELEYADSETIKNALKHRE